MALNKNRISHQVSPAVSLLHLHSLANKSSCEDVDGRDNEILIGIKVILGHELFHPAVRLIHGSLLKVTAGHILFLINKLTVSWMTTK